MQVNFKGMADQNPLSKISGWDFCLEIALPQLVNIVTFLFKKKKIWLEPLLFTCRKNVLLLRCLDFCIFVKSTDFKTYEVIIGIVTYCKLHLCLFLLSPKYYQNEVVVVGGEPE